MPTITFSGLTSGLDTSSWVEALVSVKQTTITSLQAEKEAQQSLLSVVNNIKSFFTSFQSCLQKITDSQFGIASLDLFMQNLATSSNVNILTATATTEAARQTYDVIVDQLATSTKASSGYTVSETKFATLDTTLGQLGGKAGTITVNSQSFNVSESDTIKSLIEKFSKVGVIASFDSKKSRFTVSAAIDEIDDGTTNLKNVLGLQNTTINGATSGTIVYATKDTAFSKLGLTGGNITIEGATHTITQNGNNYTIQKAGAAAASNINTIGDFLDYLKSAAVNAESATIDDKGNISIRGAVIESVNGGSNLKDVLKLGEVTERTVMQSNNLTWQKGHSADLTTSMKDLGITGTNTLVINGGTSQITETMTLNDVKDIMNRSGINMSIDTDGVITVDTNGAVISGTVLDALKLSPDKAGTTLTSAAHTVTYKADGNTLLSTLGVTDAMTYTAFKSDGTAITGTINNNGGLTIDAFIAKLQGQGLNASFDTENQKIVIEDGYIEGNLATQLGMTSTTVTHQEAATAATTLEKLGATANQTLSINGGTAKTYDKTTTLQTIINDITAAGGIVDFKDGTMAVSGVTLTGSLTGLLGFKATTQGTSVTSGALSVVTNSSSTSTGGVEETPTYDIDMTSKIGDILGSTNSYTLSVNGGTAATITRDSTLQTVSNAITAKGGTFTINDDNTVTVEGVTLSGTLVNALGLASTGQSTTMTSNKVITVGGREFAVTKDTTLAQLGATGNVSLTINNGTAQTLANTTTLGQVADKITAAGGSMTIANDGTITVDKVTLAGGIVSLLGLQATYNGTSTTSDTISITTAQTSTSSSALTPTITTKITNTTTLGEISGTTSSYTLSINGGTAQTLASTTSLNQIATSISGAGGKMTIDDEGVITIEGAEITGTVATLLGLTATGQSTEISSNDAIKMNQSFLINKDTKFGSTGTNSLGIADDRRSYAVYDSYGNLIKATSTDGSSGTGDIASWLTNINSAMNTYYGTTNKVYASVENGIIKMYDGYVAGDLPTALGMKTESIVSGKQLTGAVAQYTEANNSFIGKVSDQYIPEGAQRVSAISSFTSGKTYLISDASDLTQLATLVNSGKSTAGVTFIMTDDIDMASVTGFTPIGNSTNTFRGTFLGNGHTINNIKNESLTTNFVGVFGYTNGATIQDLGINNLKLTNTGNAATYGGGLVGYANNTTIENTYVTGDANFASGISLGNSSTSADVYGGGLVGFLSSTSTINNSYTNISTSVIGALNNVSLGGLVGSNQGNVSNSYVGNTTVGSFVVLKDYNVGGFAGENTGSISNSYALATVIGYTQTSTRMYMGGFVGHNSNGSIANSYASNSDINYIVDGGSTGTGTFGAFIGTNSGTTSIINTAYNKDTYADYSTKPKAVGTGSSTGINSWTTAQINADGNGMPKLIGNNPLIYRNIQNSSKLYDIGLTTESDRTINVTIDGVSYSKSFTANDTVENVLSYINSLTGVTATFEDSTLRVKSLTSQNITVGGKLAHALTGGSVSESNVYRTSVSGEKLYYSKNDVALSDATRVGDLLGSETTGTLNLLINDVQATLSYGPDTTIGEIISDLAQYGINASISSTGVFSATSDDKVSIFGDIGRALLGASGTTNYTNNAYESAPISITKNPALSSTTTLESLGINSGNIQVLDSKGKLLNTIDIDNTKTIAELTQVLSAYGFNLSINANGTVTIKTNSNQTLSDGSSNLMSGLHINNWTATTGNLSTNTTMKQLGYSDGGSLTVLIDGNSSMNLTFGADNTMQDIINSLSALGINASINNNKFVTSSSEHSYRLSGDLSSLATTYTDTTKGYSSNGPVTYKEGQTAVKETSTIGELLGKHEGGTLRITLNDDQVIDLEYNEDDTVQDVLDDLKNLGIDAQISNTGVFSASSSDKTFILSGNVGRALQGTAPVYTNKDTEYKSGDLSYEKTSIANNNSILKDIGVTSGQVFVLDRNGNVINTIDINDSMTIQQTKAALKSFGFDMGIDATGKITISSNDGYSLIDGSSNMISQFKLPNWTQTTSKLTAGTTLAQMGFKDGADLNMLIDGSTPTTISFGATDTMQDIINSLQALGINGSINATNGAFTATSTEHSFVFSGDLGKFLTSGTAGYVNSDKGYITEDPLMVDIPEVTNTSKELTYSHALKATDTVESMGFEDGGVVRLIVDGNTPYSFSFLKTDTMQDIMDTLATYGIQTTIDADGKVSLRSDDHTVTLGGELGSYIVQGGTYTNKDTGYTSESLKFETTEKITTDTKLSDLGVANGALNIIKDGAIAANNIQIDEETTIGQLFSAIKPYGMTGTIVTDQNGNTSIQIYSEGDTVLSDGTCDAVTKLGFNVIKQGDYESHIEYWDTGVTSGLLTESTLLTSLDKNGKTSVGSLIFELGTGDDATEHIVNIYSTDTIKTFLDKMEAEGVHAVLDNGVIKLDNSVDGITFKGGSSGIFDTLGIALGAVDTYATSGHALTYETDVTYSVANYADADTTLSTVNVTDGNMSIYVDGVKTTVAVNATDKFSDLFARISASVAAKTGVTVKAGFLDHDGNIVTNPTEDQNTGIIAIEVVGDHKVVIGASNDTTNFATIANLTQKSDERIEGTRALYKVNGNSLITGSDLFKEGDITEGTFTIGDAIFTIDASTTLNSLINQINKSDKSYASAYWDTLSGTLVIQSNLTGESLINIESGTSNFTDIMGFTEKVGGAETLVTETQTLGQNAIVRINGTTVTSTSNTITSDISKIKGLTINLKNVSAGETVTITVEQDDEGIFNAVSDIVDSYNTLMEGLEKELGAGGSFEHDTMFNLMKNQLKRLMTQSIGGTTVYKNLAAIGISTGEAQDSVSTDVTNLMIDKDKFMQALEDNSDAVKQLLVGTTDKPGVFLKAVNIVDSTLKSTGYISSTEKSINKNITRIGNKITDLTEALAHYREQLEKKFSSMERIISNMQNSYSSFLSGAG